MSSKKYTLTTALPAAAVGLLILAGALGAPAALAAQDGAAPSMAAEHAHDQPTATAAATTPPAVPVTTENVAYGEFAGKKFSGFLARPKGATGQLPGLIVIHEWWGLNDNIRDMTKRLAGEGYAALAVDLYGGQVAQDPGQAEALMEASNKEMVDVRANLRLAYDYLKQQGAPRVGVIGWCFGGGWALGSAIMLGDKLDASVIYYGRLVTEPQTLAAIHAPILGHFGGKDKSIPAATVKQFEANMQTLKKPIEVHVYPDADHAFANPSGGNYKAEAAKTAWKRTVDFLAKNLKG